MQQPRTYDSARLRLFSYVAAAALWGGANCLSPAQAQTAATQPGASAPMALEEVVVTAEYRTSTTQRTAASVSVLSGDDMLAQGRYSLSSILEDVPGVIVGTPAGAIGGASDNPASGLTIRGISSNSGAGGSITSTSAAAAIYVDGVYNGVGGGFDIDRVEALRGPQGTLYGRSATSGVIAIHTRNPLLDDFGGDISVEAGNYNLLHVTGAVNVPLLKDKLALRVSGNRHVRDGFYSPEGGQRSNTDARVKLLFTPNETFSALLGYALQDNRTHTAGVQIDQPAPDVFTSTPTAVGPGENRYRQYWAEFSLDLGPVAVTYLPALRTWYQDAVMVSRGGPLSFDQKAYTPTDRFITHELRVHSDYESALQWQAGVIHYYNKLHDQNQLILFPTGLQAFKTESRKTTEQVGAFVEGTWAPRPDTRLTAGVRFDHTEVLNNQDYTSISGLTKSLVGDEGLRKFDNSTYKVRLEHDLAPENMVYASIATGFSPGDVSVTTDTNLQPKVVLLEAQTLTAYELGSKNRFLDGRLQVNGAIYYNDYGGFQTAGINVTPENPGTPTFNTIVTPVQVAGVELEVLAVPWDNGRLSFSLGYTRARYGDIPANVATLFAQRTIPGIAPVEATLGYDHTFAIRGDAVLTLHGDLQYGSDYDTTRLTVADMVGGAQPYVHKDAQVLGNLSATWAMADRRYSVTGYVRNLADSREKYAGNVTSAVNGVVSSTATLQDPRIYGVVVSARF